MQSADTQDFDPDSDQDDPTQDPAAEVQEFTGKSSCQTAGAGEQEGDNSNKSDLFENIGFSQTGVPDSHQQGINTGGKSQYGQFPVTEGLFFVLTFFKSHLPPDPEEKGRCQILPESPQKGAAQRGTEPASQRHPGLEETEKESGHKDFIPGKTFPGTGPQSNGGRHGIHGKGCAHERGFNDLHK